MILYDVQKAFKSVFGEDITILIPKHASFGDFAVNVMQLKDRPSQKQISEYVEKLSQDKLFAHVDVQGAFINTTLSNTALKKELRKALEQKETYGSSDWGKDKIWEIEHTSPNPNKAMHLGHLRNNVYAMALSHIWEYVGIKVIRENMNNNRGIAIARLMWGYLTYGHPDSTDKDLAHWYNNQDEWDSPESRNLDPGRFVDELYVKASADFDADPDIQQAVRQMVVDWEAGDKKTRALWEKVLKYSYAGQATVLSRLGNQWNRTWNEHEHYDKGKKYVEEGLEKGIFKRTEEGTVITQLEKEYNIPNTVVLKSDGTSLYITQDLALTNIKLKETGAERLFWIVGPEQTLAFQQMFAICEQLGIAPREKLTHLSYGWMSIKGKGAMSSRSGNVVYIDDLLDEATSYAKKQIRDPEKLVEDIDSVAEKIGVGAVKYSLLKIGRTQDTAFDLKESLSFEGNSGPYLQYTYARMKSLLAKAGNENPSAPDMFPELQDAEQLLLRALPRFSDIVLEAAQSYSPHIISTYLFDLTQRFNAFYEECPILEAKAEQKAFRLALTAATAHVLKNGLGLLGIDVLERM